MAAQALGYAMAAEAISYIASDVPEGMRLGTWRAVQPQGRGRRFRIRRLRRRVAFEVQPQG
jgi:hypothetical protein